MENKIITKIEELYISIKDLVITIPHKKDFQEISFHIENCLKYISSNINEIKEIRNYNDCTQCFNDIQNILYELETLLYAAYDLNLISEQILDEKFEKIKECLKLQNGFIKNKLRIEVSIAS